MNLVHGHSWKKRKFYKVEELSSTSEGDEGDDDGRVECAPAEANLLSSELGGGGHAPVLDIDIRCELIPSSTQGHSHLYFGVELEWSQYKKLLKALGEAGILEPGYVNASLKRKATFLRPPWVRKRR